MINVELLKNKKENICVVGLGYVGLPLAVKLASHFSVIGLDVKSQRVEELLKGHDRTKEVEEKELNKVKIKYTSTPVVIKESKFIIIAVPTPINKDNSPDLSLVEKATEMVGKNLSRDSIIVYESTVYPGVTEEICIPILEKTSGLKCGKDFKVGYSPERINPGDKQHSIDKVVKVVAGMDIETVELVAEVYGAVTKVYRAKSIKVAEAAKVIENTQRDINIALMNELSVIFDKMGFSVYDVLEAAGTKWNFLNFKPGLVGGHCIGVDPYYLTYKAEQLGLDPKVILSGRHINDQMPNFIVQKIQEKMGNLKDKKCAFLGITFKEDVPDSRNSKAVDIYKGLSSLGAQISVYDPLAYHDEVEHEYGISLCEQNDLQSSDLVVIAVAHLDFKDLVLNNLNNIAKPGSFIFDIKKILSKEAVEKKGYKYWTL